MGGSETLFGPCKKKEDYMYIIYVLIRGVWKCCPRHLVKNGADSLPYLLWSSSNAHWTTIEQLRRPQTDLEYGVL